MRIEQLEQIKAGLRAGIPKEMLFDYMHALYRKARDERTFWEAPTKEAWEKERAALKEIFAEVFSPFPEKCGLAPETTAVYGRDGFRMECVCFYSAPNVIVTADLYIPDRAKPGKTPALVLACGHAPASKSFYRGVAEAACKAGMIVLCFDPTGQGERCETWDHMRWQQRADVEHDRLGALALLMGGNLAGVFAWDCMRAIDYLESRAETDPQKIGFMGTSGGGMQTTWAAALDERVAAAVPSCFITSVEELLTAREPTDSEQNPPGMLGYGLEHRDLLAMMAPKPVLVLGAEKDFFPIEGARKTVADLKRLYAAWDAQDRVELYAAPGGHAGRGMMATKGVEWLCRWFGLPAPAYSAEDVAAKEEWFRGMPAFDEDTCAAGGQLLLKPKITGYWQYYRSRIRALPPAPPDIPALARALAVDPCANGKGDALDIRFTHPYTGAVLQTEEGIRVPCLYARASGEASDRLCVLSHEDGMTELFANGREAALLLEAGVDVLAFDPRGVGTTRGGSYGWWASCARRFLKPMMEDGAINYHTLGYVDPPYEGLYATGHELGMHGIKLNRPLLGQRVADTLHVLGQLERLTRTGYRHVYVYGAGYSAVWMLYAALMTGQTLEACAFHGMIASFRLLAEAPENRYSLEHLARGLLPAGDIPQALAALPCASLLVDPAGPLRLPLDPRVGRDVLRGVPTKQIYTMGDTNPLYQIVRYVAGMPEKEG